MVLLGNTSRLLKLFCLSFLSLSLQPNSFGATNSAASASDLDVQAAVNAAKNGDTVIIPAGTNTWTTGVTVRYKTLTIIGAGIDRTLITNNVSTTTSALGVSLAQTNFFTLQSCSFATIPSSQNGIVSIGASPPKCQFRVTGCKF